MILGRGNARQDEYSTEEREEQEGGLGRIIPKMTALEQEKLLPFGEGLAFMADRAAQTQPGAVRPGA